MKKERRVAVCYSSCCLTKHRDCQKRLRSRAVSFCRHGLAVQAQQAGAAAGEHQCSHDQPVNVRLHSLNICPDLSARPGLQWTGEEPAVLQCYDLPACSLQFLLTLSPPPPVELPALPSYQRKEKTLVLDLDETLVHSQLGQTAAADFQFDLQVPEAGRQTVFVKVRPFLSQFLQVAANLFELVVFTARWATHLFSDKL